MSMPSSEISSDARRMKKSGTITDNSWRRFWKRVSSWLPIVFLHFTLQQFIFYSLFHTPETYPKTQFPQLGSTGSSKEFFLNYAWSSKWPTTVSMWCLASRGVGWWLGSSSRWSIISRFACHHPIFNAKHFPLTVIIRKDAISNIQSAFC